MKQKPKNHDSFKCIVFVSQRTQSLDFIKKTARFILAALDGSQEKQEVSDAA